MPSLLSSSSSSSSPHSRPTACSAHPARIPSHTYLQIFTTICAVKFTTPAAHPRTHETSPPEFKAATKETRPTRCLTRCPTSTVLPGVLSTQSGPLELIHRPRPPLKCVEARKGCSVSYAGQSVDRPRQDPEPLGIYGLGPSGQRRGALDISSNGV